MATATTLPRTARKVVQKKSRGRFNPYTEEFLEILAKDPKPGERARFKTQSDWRSRMYHHRDRLVYKYSWAIPTARVITKVARLGPIVEIGAGAGYWARLIREAGGDIVAYDTYPPNQRNNGYCDSSKTTYHPVLQGGPEKALEHPDRALMLCWPPYQNNMASTSLKNYAGDTLIYIGEPEGGCTADRKFFEELKRSWRQVGRCSLPQWYHMYDTLAIYQRIQ
jgi:hypothetical protein